MEARACTDLVLTRCQIGKHLHGGRTAPADNSLVIGMHVKNKFHQVPHELIQANKHTVPTVTKSRTSRVLMLFVLMSDQSTLGMAILHATESAQHRICICLATHVLCMRLTHPSLRSIASRGRKKIARRDSSENANAVTTQALGPITPSNHKCATLAGSKGLVTLRSCRGLDRP